VPHLHRRRRPVVLDLRGRHDRQGSERGRLFPVARLVIEATARPGTGLALSQRVERGFSGDVLAAAELDVETAAPELIDGRFVPATP
jgi:hypothetical protein